MLGKLLKFDLSISEVTKMLTMILYIYCCGLLWLYEWHSMLDSCIICCRSYAANDSIFKHSSVNFLAEQALSRWRGNLFSFPPISCNLFQNWPAQSAALILTNGELCDLAIKISQILEAYKWKNADWTTTTKSCYLKSVAILSVFCIFSRIDLVQWDRNAWATVHQAARMQLHTEVLLLLDDPAQWRPSSEVPPQQHKMLYLVLLLLQASERQPASFKYLFSQ